MVKNPADADYTWDNVVVGTDIEAVRFADNNNYFLIKNCLPRHHSYENIEEEWATRLYHLYESALCPFTDKVKKLRIFPEKKLLKVFTEHNVFVIKYINLYVYDDENVEGTSLERKLLHHRVIDWFDCQGLYDLDFDEIRTSDKFVNKIKLFKTQRLDGNQRYLDLLCESFLTDSQLKSFDYSDTMVRFKVTDLFEKRGIKKAKLSLWKRDIYPVYE